MSEFEKINPELSTLFLRIDAAEPSDPVLRAMAEAWRDRRGGALFPGIGLLAELSTAIRPHVFLARLTVNGRRAWLFSSAGELAHAALGALSGPVREAAEAALGPRLEALFDLVAHKNEPCAGMFELLTADGQPQLCEIFAAPIAPQNGNDTTLLAAISSRPLVQRSSP